MRHTEARNVWDRAAQIIIRRLSEELGIILRAAQRSDENGGPMLARDIADLVDFLGISRKLPSVDGDPVEALAEVIPIVLENTLKKENPRAFNEWLQAQNRKPAPDPEQVKQQRAAKREMMKGVEERLFDKMKELVNADNENPDGSHDLRLGKTIKARLNFEQLAINLSEVPLDEAGTIIKLTADQARIIWNKYSTRKNK